MWVAWHRQAIGVHLNIKQSCMLEVRPCYSTISYYIDGLAQDCSNSSALAMELLKSCSKSSKIIVYSTTSVQVQHGANLELILDTPYHLHMSQLWGVYLTLNVRGPS